MFNLARKTFILPLFLGLFGATSASANIIRVMIDPGHGGVDSGAVNGSTKESDIALKVAKLLREKLNQSTQFQADMTRVSDRTISLQERVKIAERSHAQLFLSIHLNSNPDPRARGIELYFQNHLPADEDTLFLAANENRNETGDSHQNLENIAYDEPTKKNDIASILDDLERQHRMLSSYQLSAQLMKAWNPTNQNVTIRQAPFYVVSRATIPSVLVEIGFISNAKEVEKLSTASYQSELAEKLYHGLLLYKDSLNHGVEVPVVEKN